MTETDFIAALAEFTTRTPETLSMSDDLAEATNRSMSCRCGSRMICRGWRRC